eukprot:TRINITY_DN4664_c0_g1_i3.p1 TRINITY_DN4664_c0_g1~~TRINITY_DN4664_c0_g1_i3.p1  ORF type:complete len:166 (-),score=43.14 TRINITY_DN4664_c0_g1_i3:101-598(-)
MCIRDRYQRRVHGIYQSMDDFDKIEFNVDFDDLPDNQEELTKGLSKEEKEEIIMESSLKDELSKLAATDLPKFIEKFYGIKDSPSLTFTKHEVAERVFNAPWFNKITESEKKSTAQFLENNNPKNTKYYDRKELIEMGKSLLLICLLYTSPSPRDLSTSRMPSSA